MTNKLLFTYDKSKATPSKHQPTNTRASAAAVVRQKVEKTVVQKNPSAFHVRVKIQGEDSQELIPAIAQIDSGCTRSMINRSFAKAVGLTIQPLKKPLKVEGCNHTLLDHVDGRVQLQLSIGHHKEIITLWTMNLTDDADLLLGYDWLLCHNPQIDWENGTFTLEKCLLLRIEPVRQADDQCLGIWDQALNEKDKLYLMDIQGYLTRQDNPWKIHRKERKDKTQIILDYPK